jgi:hypothetical protein
MAGSLTGYPALMSFVETGQSFQINSGAKRFSPARQHQRPHRSVLSQALKDRRDLLGEFKIHRVGGRTPQGDDGDRALLNDFNHAGRHVALPCGAAEFFVIPVIKQRPVADPYSAASCCSPGPARPRATSIDL